MIHSKSKLAPYLPEAAVDYCHNLWVNHSFHLKIASHRTSKLGDYKYHPPTKQHYISVNETLNPYSFLIVYLHEVAHLISYANRSKRFKPHGKEWQQAFRILMAPMLVKEIFPEDVLAVLKKHMIKPSASSGSDLGLKEALRKYDARKDETPGQTSLSHLRCGDVFLFRGRAFTKIGEKRKRSVCQAAANGKNYLISKAAEVQLIEAANNPEESPF